MHSLKEINVFLFFLFGFYYEVYLHFCHCQQNTFSKNVRRAATQISAKLHILFQFTKRAFCLDTSVYSKKNSFVRKNTLQIFLSIFQKCFCYRKHFVSFFQWCFTVVSFDALFLVRAIFTFFALINAFSLTYPVLDFERRICVNNSCFRFYKYTSHFFHHNPYFLYDRCHFYIFSF